MTDGSDDSTGGGLAGGPADGLGLGPTPVVSPGRTHLLWDNGHGTAAVWRLRAPGAEGRAEAGERRLFGPFAGWTARALAVGPDGRVFLLWTGRDRAASLWSVDMEAGPARRGELGGAWHGEFGPYDGWEARTLAVGPDGTLRILWTGADGTAALWSLPEWSLTGGGFGGGEPEALDCGPFAGWAARSLAVGPDNLAHLLWTRGDGAASVWRVESDGRVQPSEYGPYSGWDAVGVAAAPGGASRLLWRSAGGFASLWDTPQAGGNERAPDESAPDERPQTVYGPFKGWSAVGVTSAGADGAAHLLWRHDGGGLASVWHLGGAGRGGHEEHGPYAGWVPVALALGP